MSTTYPFDTDDGWNVWGTSFAPQIALDPEVLGITAAMAQAVTSAAALYSQKLQEARAPDTRSKPAIQAKRDALESLKQAVRPVVAILRTNENVSDETRVELGLKVADGTKTPVAVPATPPMVDVMPTGLLSARAVVRDPADPDRRAKPRGVKSILVRAMLTDGPVPAEAVADWPVRSVESAADFDLAWPDLRQPATVWVACSWLTTRNEEGRPSTPVSTRLAGTGQATATAARTGEMPMKIAA